ncbi:MAG: hypothetical protein V7637_1767 [Mycobacteriales bacterium]
MVEDDQRDPEFHAGGNVVRRAGRADTAAARSSCPTNAMPALTSGWRITYSLVSLVGIAISPVYPATRVSRQCRWGTG